MISSVNSSHSYLFCAVILLGGVATGGCTSEPVQDSGSFASTISASPSDLAEIPTPISGRSRAIDAYREHLTHFPDSPEYDAINRRLADLLLQEATALHLSIAAQPADADKLQRHSARSYREAISRYEDLLAKSPQDPELLYQLSRAFEESGQSLQAIEVIDRLVGQPEVRNPRLQSDTLFRRGEIQFSLARFRQAENSYRAIIDLGSEAPAYAQSLYKLGWSLFKQERYQEALAPFFAYLDYRLDETPSHDPANADLTWTEREQLDQVFEVVSQCFAMLGGAGAVEKYFSANDAVVDEEQVYLSLATWYETRNQISEAAETWLMLAQRDPLGAAAPTYTATAIRLYRENDFLRPARNIQATYVENFGHRSRFWEYHDIAEYPNEIRMLEHSLQTLAEYYHDQFQQRPGFGYADMARKYYVDYLQWFPTSESGTAMRFQLAELLFEQQRFEEAYGRLGRTTARSWTRSTRTTPASRWGSPRA